MNFTRFSLFTIFFIFVQFSNAQICGNIATKADIKRLLVNKEIFSNSPNTKSPETVYIPITFHIVSTSDGKKGLSESQVVSQLCALNNDYVNQDIIFYLKNGGFNYIENTNLFENPTGSTGNIKMIQEKGNAGKNSINVFICENADTGSNGTTLGYYDPTLDVLVMRKSEVNAFTGTLAHEMGHYFSLLHVFNGWDSSPWDADEHGNPVSSQFSPGGVKNELADGSNCEVAGDYLCDTPADYNLGYGWTGCSNYTGGCKDFDGGLLEPDEENFMGYFIGCSEYHFSQEQKEVVRTDYESNSREEIRVNYVPNLTEISQTTLISPEDGDEIESYNIVKLEWEKVDAAVGYVIELKQGITKTRYISSSNKITLNDLKSDKTYTWKVLPYSELGGCLPFTISQTFSTGNLLDTNIMEGYSIEVYPTILSSNFGLTIKSSTTFDAEIEIINISGQTIGKYNKNIVNGINKFSVDKELTKGIYFMQLSSKGETSTFRLIVQ